MGATKPKTRYLVEVSLRRFVQRHPRTSYYWTFTEPPRFGDPKSKNESVQLLRDSFIGPFPRRRTKDEAEAAFKPFRDLVARRGGEIIVVWERQTRGSWHPHCVTDKYFDVHWLRDWMMQRGWGQQMRVEKLGGRDGFRDGQFSNLETLVRYLSKYLTKTSTSVVDLHKKLFGCSRSAKVGCVKFSWTKFEKAGAFLWSRGRDLWFQVYGRAPSFRDMMAVIRLGVEDTGWVDVDFLWEFGFNRGP